MLVCFPLRTVAFRGHGFSLLEKPTLRGLQTRAIPANVFGGTSNRSPRSQRSSATNNYRKVEVGLDSIVAKHYVSEGNTRRLLRESEDDETPKRVFFASEEAHREPAESVVYFRSGILYRSLVSIKTVCIPL